MAFLSWYFILFYAITLSCGLLVWRTFQMLPPRPLGWIWVAIAVVGLTWVVNFLSMQWAVVVGGVAWCLWILLPSVGLRHVQRLMYRQRYHVAYRWSLVLRCLHPFDGWWEQPQIIHALDLSQRGQIAAAQTLLAQHSGRSSLISQQAIAMHYALQLDWRGLITWLGTTQEGLRDPLLTMYYCRALAETGQLHELLLLLDAAQGVLLQGGDRRNFHLVQLFTAAFCGEVKLVQQLLTGALAVYPKAIQHFWVAIAHYAAGQPKLGQRLLQELANHPDQAFQRAVQSRLQQPPTPSQKLLRPASYPLIARLTRQIQQEKVEQAYQSLVDYRPLHQQGLTVHGALVVLNCLLFAVGLVLNTTVKQDALMAWGSFVPNLVWHGQWWRIITATFIHVGWAHLLTNMFTLSLLGGFAEKHLGRWRYLTVYLLSGVVTMVTLLGLVAIAQHFDYASFPRWLAYLTAEIQYAYRQWVGASGAIMGMIGAIAVVLFQGWQRTQSKLALKQLRLIMAIILLQFAIDLTSPSVSFYSHLLGFCWGMIFTAWLTRQTTNHT